MKNFAFLAFSAATCGVMAMSASAAVVSSNTAAPAPTYATTLNFDEVGGPTGSVAPNAYSAIGITSIQGGSADLQVAPGTAFFPWAPSSNVGYGNFGIHIQFANDVTSFSAQVWDNGGNVSPFGGLYFNFFNNGVAVGSAGFNGPFGGIGNTWFNFTTTAGTVFDEVSFGGNAFGFPETMVDNMSWNAVPAPGCLALLGLAGFTGLGRRRR
jgi:hypothetical protein